MFGHDSFRLQDENRFAVDLEVEEIGNVRPDISEKMIWQINLRNWCSGCKISSKPGEVRWHRGLEDLEEIEIGMRSRIRGWG